MCDAQKTTMAAVPEQVSINAAIASVLSQLDGISSLKEEQRMTLKIFLIEIMFSLVSRLTLVRV